MGGSAGFRRLQEVTDPLIEGEEEPLVGEFYRQAVEQVRQEFNESTWQMFWQTVIEGGSPALLAEELGVSAAAVRQAKSRVLRRIKQELGELLE